MTSLKLKKNIVSIFEKFVINSMGDLEDDGEVEVLDYELTIKGRRDNPDFDTLQQRAEKALKHYIPDVRFADLVHLQGQGHDGEGPEWVETRNSSTLRFVTGATIDELMSVVSKLENYAAQKLENPFSISISDVSDEL